MTQVTRESLQYELDWARWAVNDNPSAENLTKLSNASKALQDFAYVAPLQADITYMAEHIDELEVNDCVAVFDYSEEVDNRMDLLCAEYGM